MLKSTELEQMQPLSPINLSNVILPQNIRIGSVGIRPENLETIEFSNNVDIVQHPGNNSYLEILDPEPEEVSPIANVTATSVGISPIRADSVTPTNLQTGVGSMLSGFNNRGGGSY